MYVKGKQKNHNLPTPYKQRQGMGSQHKKNFYERRRKVPTGHSYS